MTICCIHRVTPATRGRLLWTCLPLACAISLLACGSRQAPASKAIQLVDLYEKSLVTGSITTAHTPPPPTIWKFDGPAPDTAPTKAAATRGWEAGPGISNLKIQGGRLVGSTTKDISLLHFERTPGDEGSDTLHSIEIRMKASAGTNMQIDFSSEEKIDLAEQARGFHDFRAVVTSTPILAGLQMRTYTLASVFTATSASIRHILLRPTDAVGATFEIESIRLVFRHEYLERIASGPGWQGLSEIYHETIVTRSPEQLSYVLPLPSHPWLDLSIGTVEDHPITFKITARDENASEEKEAVLLEHTLTRPHRWERTPVDLAAFAGHRVSLSFSILSPEDGSIGLWGAPVIRDSADDNATATAQSSTPRGVIVIWADTLRRDHLHTYGYSRDTSPELDRMAREGVLFSHNVSQATWTKVATPVLLTSLYPATNGVADFSDRIPAAATTMAEVFRSAGRATLSMSSILFTGKFTNLHQGFEELHESGSLPDKNSSKTAREYVDRLLPWLDRHRDVPYFVFLHISDPHDPFKPYPPYDTMWGDRSKEKVHEQQQKDVRKFIDEPLLKAFGMPTRADLSEAGFDPDAYVGIDRDWYDGSIRAMDAEVGRVLQRLRSPAFAGRALVVFIGDHGEEFLDHGRTFHGQSVYSELSNTPLIVWGPGFVPQGRTVNETVETIDVMPTVLSLCALDAPKEVQGRNLRPLLASSGAGVSGAAAAADSTGWNNRPAFTQKAATKDGGGAPPPDSTESFAVTLDGWKLIHHTKLPPAGKEFELFEVEKDPLNATDVAAAHPAIVQRLSELIDAWRKETQAARLASDEQANKDISPEDLERLRSLGYVQ